MTMWSVRVPAGRPGWTPTTCALVKRRMGMRTGGSCARADVVGAGDLQLILKSLISDAAFSGEQVQRAVITVPAYFGDDERRATIQAGSYAGIEVAGVLSEPIAAALSYRFSKITDAFSSSTPDEKVLVYDLGGGTFDATVIELADRRISCWPSTAIINSAAPTGTNGSRCTCRSNSAPNIPTPRTTRRLRPDHRRWCAAAERAKHELSDSGFDVGDRRPRRGCGR